MEIKNSFEIPLPPNAAWDVLMESSAHRTLHARRRVARANGGWRL